MKKVSDMIGAAIGREEVARLVRANLILRDWPAIVGPMLAARSHPDKFERGTVWVAVEGSAWAQELRMSKETILRRLRTRSDEPALFQDIRFGVRPLPAPVVPGAEPVEAGPPPSGSIREIAERRLQEWHDAGGT